MSETQFNKTADLIRTGIALTETAKEMLKMAVQCYQEQNYPASLAAYTTAYDNYKVNQNIIESLSQIPEEQHQDLPMEERFALVKEIMSANQAVLRKINEFDQGSKTVVLSNSQTQIAQWYRNCFHIGNMKTVCERAAKWAESRPYDLKMFEAVEQKIELCHTSAKATFEENCTVQVPEDEPFLHTKEKVFQIAKKNMSLITTMTERFQQTHTEP